MLPEAYLRNQVQLKVKSVREIQALIGKLFIRMGTSCALQSE